MQIPLSSVLVVIPALNEQASVASVIRDVQRALPEVTCLVVDDGSTDNTSAVAERAGALVLTLPFNLGVGGALRAGFRYARREGFQAMVQVDADGQHDPNVVGELVAALADADIVIGARFAGVGSYGVRGPRRWAMKTLAWLISRLSRSQLTDVTSGFKATGPRAISLFADNFPAEYLGDTIEALVIASRAGLRIAQVPVEMRPRQAGEPSHGPFKSAIYLVRAGAAFALAVLRPRSVVQETP